MIPEWMKAIAVEHKPQLSSPRSVSLNGERHVCATDGHMIVAVKSDADVLDYEAKVASKMREFLSAPTPYVTTLAELQLTKPPSMELKTCDLCEGDGCDWCEDGKVEPEAVYTAIGNVTYNMRLAWRALAHLSGDIVRVGVGSEDDALTLATDDWRIVLMPTTVPVCVATRFHVAGLLVLA